MDSHESYHDPMQKAADEAGGHEGKGLKHNNKTGEVLLDGAAISSTLRFVFFMDEATHGYLQFDEDRKLIYSDTRRFTVEKPNRDEKVPEDFKPNTSCLCIIQDTGQIATYQSASWSARSAFMTQLLKPYVRARKAGILPVATLSFKEGQSDDHGNYLPYFEIVGWVPRAKYAMILGEIEPPPAIAAPPADVVPAINAAPPAVAAPVAPLPRPSPSPLMIVTSGLQKAPSSPAAPPAPSAPAANEDDGYNPGPSSLDDYDY
jgi:hypothetical protein